MRLLVAEDDEALSTRLKASLKKEGFAVDVADNGDDAHHFGMEEDYDLVILDLGLPQRSGLDVLKSWRNEGRAMPVLVLTARDAWHERVDGFQAGADDYLGKPFHLEELLERIKALIRRNSVQPAAGLTVAEFRLDESRQCLIHTTSGEET